MGNFVHDILEEMYKLPAELRTIENCRPISKQLWDDKWEDEALKVVDGFKVTYKMRNLSDSEALNKFRWKAWWCIENLWKIENPQEKSPTGLEHELNGKIAGVVIKGFIDRFSEEGSGYVISDYKTGNTPKANWVQDKFFQLVVYSHLLESTGVGKAESVELLYLKDGVSFKRDVTEQMLLDVEKQVLEVKEKIDISCQNEDFKPTKSLLCDYCSYRKVCPAWRS